MLRTLVLQLSSQLNDNDGLLSHLHENYRNAMPPYQALMDCLRQLVREFDDVYILLDALDESPRHRHRGDMLQALIDLQAWSEPGLYLLVTSRDEIDIREVLRDELHLSPDMIVLIKNDSIDADMALFVSGYLKASRGLRRWNDYRDQIEKALLERANGVYVLCSPSRGIY